MKTIRILIPTVFLLLFFLLPEGIVSAQQGPNRAGLVIQFSDGSVFTRCVEFSGETISGYDLLAASGVALESSYDPGQGAAVCRINQDGCSPDNCFCAMPQYWRYFHMNTGAWVYSGQGSSNAAITNGGVDGWRFSSTGEPPVIPFEQICASAPTETATPLPATETPLPSSTIEPSPTSSLTPTETLTPAVVVLYKSSTPTITPTSTIQPATTTPFIAPTATIITPSQTPKPSPTISQSSASSILPTVTQTSASSPSRTNLVPYLIFGILCLGMGIGFIIYLTRKPE